MQGQSSQSYYYSSDQLYDARSREHSYAAQAGYANRMAEEQRSTPSHAHFQSRDAQPARSPPGATHGHGGYQQHQYAEYQQWRAVPRAWEEVNPEAAPARPDAGPIRVGGAPGSRTEYSQGHAPHGHMSHHPDTSRSHEPSTGLPISQLTASGLRYYDAHQASTSGMEQWLRSQREGPYDGVGYVRRQDGDERSSGL